MSLKTGTLSNISILKLIAAFVLKVRKGKNVNMNIAYISPSMMYQKTKETKYSKDQTYHDACAQSQAASVSTT